MTPSSDGGSISAYLHLEQKLVLGCRVDGQAYQARKSILIPEQFLSIAINTVGSYIHRRSRCGSAAADRPHELESTINSGPPSLIFQLLISPGGRGVPGVFLNSDFADIGHG